VPQRVLSFSWDYFIVSGFNLFFRETTAQRIANSVRFGCFYTRTLVSFCNQQLGGSTVSTKAARLRYSRMKAEVLVLSGVADVVSTAAVACEVVLTEAPHIAGVRSMTRPADCLHIAGVIGFQGTG
jgi:hypothetical protein